MAYFLKKMNQANNTYLAIYESYYSKETKGTKHNCIKSLGSITKLIKDGIEDPITYYQEEVDKMNIEAKNNKVERKQKQISEVSPIRYVGYFPLAYILNILDVKDDFDLLQSERRFKFNVYDIFTTLMFARVVAPLSKYKTFHDILPCLYKNTDKYSYDQLLDCINFLGLNYEKYIEIFTKATKDNYGLVTSKTYFDCTNFYFEIDYENDFQRKGPSKENFKGPIVGMGLLLDKNLIPISMKMYPGNESEIPHIRSVINSLKKQNNIEGKTIQIADKGLNCAENIHKARKQSDGYLFSKSIKKLDKKEKIWILNNIDYHKVLDDDENIKYYYKSCIDTFEYEYYDENNKKITFKTDEKRLVTYNPSLAKKQIYEINKLVNKAKNNCLSKAKKSEYGDCSKYVIFKTESNEKIEAELNEDKIAEDKKIAGFNLLVTSELNMSDKDMYDSYHNLWAIEQSFRIMKTELDARPVYLQKQDSIKGHFLICYTAVLLTRLLQFKELKSALPNTQLFEFFRNFKVIKLANNQYVNISTKTKTHEILEELTNHPLSNYYLTDKQLKMMHTR